MSNYRKYITLIMALSEALNELMNLIRDEKINVKEFKFELKRDYNALESLTKRATAHFEKSIEGDEVLQKGYEMYSEYFKEMVYSHLDELDKT